MTDANQEPIRCPRCGQAEPSLVPAFGSDEHRRRIARQLSKNLRLRRLVERER